MRPSPSKQPHIPSQICTSPKVRLRRLTLGYYRNYPRLQLDVPDGHLVLCGANGAGKTNILEAVSLLSPGRGLRRATYANMIHAGVRGTAEEATKETGKQSRNEQFFIHACLKSDLYGEVNIGTGNMRTPTGEERRIVRINGAPQALDNLLDYTRVIWLTPAMDGLFVGSTSDRRRFLDRLVLAVDPRHGRYVTDYEKAMRARNRLLMQRSGNAGWFDALETQMASLGVAVAAARWHLVDQLRILAEQVPLAIAGFPTAMISLDGLLEEKLQQGQAAIDLEEEFYHQLGRARHDDRLAGRTTLGPHRTDIKIIHQEKSIPAFLSSTGEQKALLAGLILAHARLCSQISGFTPLLLLDEITAHLDETRSSTLFDLIDDIGAQALLTGTERSLFSHLEGRAQFLTISDNKIFAI